MAKTAEDKLVCPHCGAEESTGKKPFSEWGLKVHIARMHGPNHTPKKNRRLAGVKGAAATHRNRLPVVVLPANGSGQQTPPLTLESLMSLAAREIQSNRRVKCCPKCGHHIALSEIGEIIAEKILEKLKHETPSY
jgi:DNA-directed RNA polymerase subunit RPC12/RpoP